MVTESHAIILVRVEEEEDLQPQGQIHPFLGYPPLKLLDVVSLYILCFNSSRPNSNPYGISIPILKIITIRKNPLFLQYFYRMSY